MAEEVDIDVLKAIYPEACVSDNGTIILDVPVVLAVSDDDAKEISFAKAPKQKVRFLPPVRLEIAANEIRISASWLPEAQRKQVIHECAGLDPLSAIDHVSTQAQVAFDLELRLLPDSLSPLIAHHDALERRAHFNRRAYACEICLDYKPGVECAELPCKHCFCSACLHEMFALYIREGLIEKVVCPLCAEELPRPLLRSLVTTEEYNRYAKLVIRRRIEALPSSTRCPREFCAAAVERPDPDDKLAVCGECEYAFCADCLRGWHGVQEPCRRSTLSAEFARHYLAATTDEQRKLDRLYGPRNIQRLLLDLEHDELARKWVDANAMRCPECETAVERSMGCAHMTCRCGTHWCFNCGASISKLNPYAHFSDKSLACYGQLFNGMTGAEGPFPEWID
ncbi:hypothetical protein PYCC9005_001395 [Savitreella phatthalungensis]